MEIVVTTENFEEEVLHSEIPVLVDFYAEWCGPCKMMAPTLSQFARDNAEKVKVCKCDIDMNTELVQKYKIRSVPTLLMFDGGEQQKKSIGVISKDDMEEMLQ